MATTRTGYTVLRYGNNFRGPFQESFLYPTGQ
ncbi:unnamed protein product, partial [marine sediment metagenome]